MEYRYKRGQLFGKKLNVPKDILNKVYNCTLTFNEYIEYGLDEKIPITCIMNSDRKIVDKFGIEKCKNLDWDLLNKYDNKFNSFKDIVMSIDSDIDDINTLLYEEAKKSLKPIDYTPKMKEAYPNDYFDVLQNDDDNLKKLKSSFNEGRISLEEIINNWGLFKEKDLDYSLLNDYSNKNHITNAMLKDFMHDYENLAPLIIEHDDISNFVSNIASLSTSQEKHEFVAKFTNELLNNTYKKAGESRPPIKLSDTEYREIFKYSSMEDYFKNFADEYLVNRIMGDLSNLPEDYIYNLPFSFFDNLSNTLDIAGKCGIQNIVDFDNECNHFLTMEQDEMLTKLSSYIGNRSCDSKEEFYDLMKQIVTTHEWQYTQIFDYRNMTGEFQKKYPELFISEEAPQELKDLFYTKAINPQTIINNPNYVKYLNGKDLANCFEQEIVMVDNGDYTNLYTFLNDKMSYEDTIQLITEYNDVLNIVLHQGYPYRVSFSEEDNANEILNKINAKLRQTIIEKQIVYPSNIPKKFIEMYPSMFLNIDSPKELQEAFYSRNITTEFILSNPSYAEILKNSDLEVIFKYMPINMLIDNPTNSSEQGLKYQQMNFVNAVKQTFGSENALDVMLLYGKYIEKAYEVNKLKSFSYTSSISKDEFFNEMDKTIFQNIVDGKMKYDENMPSHFKNNNPSLFLNDNVSQEIKDKFYNREFTIKDFSDNPELFELFNDTNIACGFPENMSWIITMFNDSDNLKLANSNRMKLISEYSKINDVEFQKAFQEYVIECGNNINFEKMGYISEVLTRLSVSNSSEIFTFRKELATQILKSNNPLESLNKIEDVFTKNNIPTVGKIYSCFEILHPNLQGFDFENSMVSPVLKNSSVTSKQMIIFADLIKTSFGSNNRSINSYLQNIDKGSHLYKKIKSGELKFDSLGIDEQSELDIFSKHLSTLYNNTAKGKTDSFSQTGNSLADIVELEKRLSPNGTDDYNLEDRVIRMFCGFAGIDTLEQAKEYIKLKIDTADSRNRNSASSDMSLEQGDFVKGIGNITYLRDILQNGSVSKEYLGSSADSDRTPLDTDVSMIMSSDGTISEKMNATAASSYGPIWFVLKNDDRFMTTRTGSKTLSANRDMSKMEAFYTGVSDEGHYGIRTGFASSEINYIVMDNYDPRVGLEIAMNGFYIPVANKEGKIIFTPKDYDSLKEKMSGLSYFGENEYKFSDNLVTQDTIYLAQQIEESNKETQVKREKINAVFKESLEELGLQLKTNIDGDLTDGFVELIDTGSTGRGTNKPGDGDFDFMMRLDKSIISDPSKLHILKTAMLTKLGQEHTTEMTGNGDFRLKNVEVDSNTHVDIDVTFTEKTDKVYYSTDVALKDRLDTIKKADPEKYKYVVANILLAKQTLKNAEVYKPNRGETPQGGLGGVGIENWILQNGGSFIDAANSFIEAADGKSFSEFQSSYHIWDFGDNHLAERRGQYPHDNFVTSNMSEEGYNKMVNALKEYVNRVNLGEAKIDDYEEYRANIRNLYLEERENGEILHSRFDIISSDKPQCEHTVEKITKDGKMIISQRTFDYNDNFRQKMLAPSIIDYADCSPVMTSNIQENNMNTSMNGNQTANYYSTSENNNILSVNNIETQYAKEISNAVTQITPQAFQKQQEQQKARQQEIGGVQLTRTLGSMGGYVKVGLLAVAGFILSIIIIILGVVLIRF